MRIVIFLLLLASIVSCEKNNGDSDSRLDLIFELRYDGKLLSGHSEFYSLNDSLKVQFSKVSFYLSDFRLSGTAETLPLLDVLHFSFLQDINGDAIKEMQQTLRFEVPPGEYKSFGFGLGLTPSQNTTTPADHKAGSALSLTSAYWPAWESYIFEKIEGAYKLNDREPESMALHVGSNETYRRLNWEDGLTMKTGEVKKIIIPIDLKNVLDDYPLSKFPVLHKLEELPYMEMIADRFSASMKN